MSASYVAYRSHARSQMSRALVAALKGLSDTERLILLARYADRLTVAEAAMIAGVSRETAAVVEADLRVRFARIMRATR